ncbi:hypothetical protein HPB52_008022 [Rhipicephalus sanguineus]|uniref:Amino acid transporter n=1 Tax=Rhipicephalus sanguineus TaxID=34632 RepID=A0A9D4QLX4_RHISA|nr:hypothetical protein HPB52_008022 [Rhipicephalus sanguineus]
MSASQVVPEYDVKFITTESLEAPVVGNVQDDSSTSSASNGTKGVFGYLTFGQGVASDILELYDARQPLVLVGILAMALKIITTYPILTFCGRTAVDDLYGQFRGLDEDAKRKRELFRRITIVSIWFCTTVVLACLVPNISIVIRIIGSLAATFIFVFPGLCLLFVSVKLDNYYYFAKTKWKLAIAVLCVALGTFVFGQVLTMSIMDAASVYRKGHAPVSHEGTPLWNDAEPAAKRKKPSDPGEEPSEKTDAAKDAEKPGEPPDPGVLIKALADLENTASSDAVVRERIASLPPEVSDASLLEKIQDRQAADRLSAQVEEACSLLAEYNSRLAQELEDRKQVSQMLASFTFHQRELMALAEQKLEEHRDKLHKVTHVRNELKSHLQNLPDLTLLPSVTGGLAPLPSAGDLFSHQ